MTGILNITNGDSAVAIMQQAGIPGEILPWRDVLHDGPVPGDLSLEALSEIRTDFIASRGWGQRDEIARSFLERDETLKAHVTYHKVVLWFEHDLYDQLQILQILNWFQDFKFGETHLSMICVDRYLGMMTADEMAAIQDYEQAVSLEQLSLACLAWNAFTSDTPLSWFNLLNANTTCLPFLGGAVSRLLEEYPGQQNGLSRTAQKALEIVSTGINQPVRVFAACQQSEERKFMGDSSFWVVLNEMIAASPALLRLNKGKEVDRSIIHEQQLTITAAGGEVLSGQRNYLDCIKLDRWIGGVHLTDKNSWVWDASYQSIGKQ